MSSKKIILQISCPDKSGLIAAFTQGIAQSGANILDLTQHTAKDINKFFMRAFVECEADAVPKIKELFSRMENEKSLQWQLYDAQHKTKLALFGSTTNHCIYELLLSHEDGVLPCEFTCIVSNHTALEPIARAFNLPFFLVPSDIPKPLQEEKFNDILRASQTEGVVLARYMQILSEKFTDKWKYRIINIHHGFLPAFKGAKPYHQAWAKGVKLIGATAHFATADLDQGPIIWQSVQQVADTGSIEQFIQIGKEVEKRTLLNAVKLYLERRVFLYDERTFIL
ncbi:MAG: formyltetrahydrofolate deformylase [Chitinispirillales bacterium]|jgi:formyltetrahydrofolate deformylase|nr:formyltetrahydrofolate deformylase [Chitinispirillales bacterium]